MHVLDAALATVENSPGGAESLAPRMGMSAAILRNKVNRNCTTNHLTLLEADRMIGLTGDMQILQALAANHSCAVVALDESGQGGSVTTRVLQLDMAEGDLSRAIHDAIADGVISGNDAAAISTAGLEVQGVLIRLVAQLRASTPTPSAV